MAFLFALWLLEEKKATDNNKKGAKNHSEWSCGETALEPPHPAGHPVKALNVFWFISFLWCAPLPRLLISSRWLTVHSYSGGYIQLWAVGVGGLTDIGSDSVADSDWEILRGLSALTEAC